MWFIGVEVEQETSVPPPEKYPGSAPETYCFCGCHRRPWILRSLLFIKKGPLNGVRIRTCMHVQGCQPSWITQGSPDFGLYLPVPRNPDLSMKS